MAIAGTPRAWCEDNGEYRDFVLSRIKDAKWPGEVATDLPKDEDWQTMETISLKPHHKLSAKRRRAIELDYGIQPGKALELSVRLAMKEYLLAHLRVEQEGLPQHFELVDL